MKKLIVGLGLLFTGTMFSQSNEFGVISASIGANYGFGIASLNIGDDVSFSSVGETVSFNACYPIELNVGILKPLGLGVQYSPTTFLFATGDGALKLKVKSIAANINLYPVNKDRFNMELSLSPGKLLFNEVNLNRLEPGLKAEFKGSIFKTRLKFNFYFSDDIGMYGQVGYDSYKAKLIDYSLEENDEELEMELDELIDEGLFLGLGGLNIGMGFNVKFAAFSRD